ISCRYGGRVQLGSSNLSEQSSKLSESRHRQSIVEIHLTLNWSCRLDEAFGASCSANSEPAVHLSLNYLEFGSFNFELSGAYPKL
ncbi:hypothetical protein, partial [Paraburkholderia elongata]|uniref:hypothetical protein n=1 Tax=Paraburkholderia elongata TaxID=2675747 RepID=UPI001C12F206